MKKLLHSIRILILPAVVFLLFVLISGGRFASFNILKNILLQAVYPTIIGWALYSVMEMKFWDFTPGSILLLSGILGGNLAELSGLGIGGLILFTVGTATLLSLFNCLVFTYAKIPSMIAGCGVLMIYETLAAISFGGSYSMNRDWSFLARAPWAYIIFGACLLFRLIVNNRTVFGYNVRSLGKGSSIAVSIGVNFNRTRFFAYLIEGILLGIAAILYMGTQGSASALMNMASSAISLSAIIAYNVGKYLEDYCDPTIGIWVGTFTLKIISTGLLALGLDTCWQKVANGVFFIVLILFFHLRDLLKLQRDRRQILRELTAGTGRAEAGG